MLGEGRSGWAVLLSELLPGIAGREGGREREQWKELAAVCARYENSGESTRTHSS